MWCELLVLDAIWRLLYPNFSSRRISRYSTICRSPLNSSHALRACSIVRDICNVENFPTLSQTMISLGPARTPQHRSSSSSKWWAISPCSVGSQGGIYTLSAHPTFDTYRQWKRPGLSTIKSEWEKQNNKQAEQILFCLFVCEREGFYSVFRKETNTSEMI